MPLIAPEFRLKKSLERFYGAAAELEEEAPERLDLTEAIRQLSELISSKLR